MMETLTTGRPLYRVRHWDTIFENSRSRSFKKLDWVPIPNKHDGKSYRRLIAMENGLAMYAAWLLIVQVASKCPQRGVLADEDGPLDASDLSFKTGVPADVFVQAFQVLSSPEIGWLAIDPSDHCQRADSALSASCQRADSALSLNRTEENRTEGNGHSSLSPDGDCESGLSADSSKDDSEKTASQSTSLKFSDEDLKLAQEMFDGIKEIQPNARPPNLPRWANEFRLMREHDGQDRTPDNIRATLAWVRQDQFWKSNVLSPAKLREKWDQLQIKRKVQNESRPSSNKPDGLYRETTKPGGHSF
jgi:hypothetical protein